jgi:hypothetical protein
MSGVANAASPLERLSTVSSGIRVVILEQDHNLQTRLRRRVDENPAFSLTSAVTTWLDCERQLQELVPELLVARRELVPTHALSQLLHCIFPVQIWLGAAIPAPSALALPEMDDSAIRTALREAGAEIFRRKACELSTLLELYLAGTREITNYVTSLKLPDEHGIADVPVDNIVLISASGNYVRVHTIERTYEIRETLSGIAGRLSTVCFVRVHRSHIVNLAYVCELVRNEGELHLVLNEGIAVPVGPNYRDEIAGILADKMRLIA